MKVLIADDEDTISRHIEEAIINQYPNCEVYKFSNGQQAWQKLQTEEFDFIILDNKMPNMNGVDILRKIEESSISAPPACIISGVIPKDLFKIKYSNKLFAFEKPFSLAEIVDLIY